jgi:hypothetical protein
MTNATVASKLQPQDHPWTWLVNDEVNAYPLNGSLLRAEYIEIEIVILPSSDITCHGFCNIVYRDTSSAKGLHQSKLLSNNGKLGRSCRWMIVGRTLRNVSIIPWTEMLMLHVGPGDLM